MSLAQAAVWTLCALAALGLLAEFGARLWLRLRGQYFVWTPYARTRMELDREILPDLEPVVHIEINQAGERGDMLPEHWNDTYRVLVVGGSVAECYFLDQQSSWPHVIQRILSAPENLKQLAVERVHVGNIARSLVACEHLDLMLERVLPRYERLDAIVFMVGASDVVHWLEQGTPVVVPDKTVSPSLVFASHPEGPFGWTPKTLALRRIASRWRRRIQRPIEVRLKAGKRLGAARKMRANAAQLLSEVPDAGPMLAHFDKYFRKLLARARAKAARVIVVRQPWFDKQFDADEQQLLWNFGAGRPYEEQVSAYYEHRVVWELMRQVDRRASAIARELGVEQIDLMPVLERNFEIYYDELHHTPKGCEVVGREVARQILQPPDAATRPARK